MATSRLAGKRQLLLYGVFPVLSLAILAILGGRQWSLRNKVTAPGREQIILCPARRLRTVITDGPSEG